MTNDDISESRQEDNNNSNQHKETDVNDHQKTFTLESILSGFGLVYCKFYCLL